MLWDVATRRLLLDKSRSAGMNYRGPVAFSPDGITVAAASRYISSAGNGITGVVLWNLPVDERLVNAPLAVPEGDVESVAFSPDGKTVAAAVAEVSGVSSFNGVVLWHADARKRVFDEPFAVKEGVVKSVAFSPDGKTIAAGYVHVPFGNTPTAATGGVVLWDVAARARFDEPIAVNEDGVWSVAFSPEYIKKPGPQRGGRAQPGRTTLARDSSRFSAPTRNCRVPIPATSLISFQAQS